MSGSELEEIPRSTGACAPPRFSTPQPIHCKVRGSRHERAGLSGQDAVFVEQRQDFVSIAVADGHGTSLHGCRGAELAVQVAVERLLAFASELGSEAADSSSIEARVEYLPNDIVQHWVARVQQDSDFKAEEFQPYGSTLIFALSTPECLLIGQLGDGDILLVSSDGRVKRPIEADPNDFADETASLCQRQPGAMRWQKVPAPVAETLLLLTTDGYSKSYATDQIFELVGPDYLTMIREEGAANVERQLPEILKTVSVGGAGDDIAIGMLYWPGPRPEDSRADQSLHTGL